MLRVLDGAVLVVSAVEGVQPQTRVLMRALRRLRIPTLLFVNKIDGWVRERGPCCERSPDTRATVIPMGTTSALGTKAADFNRGERTTLTSDRSLAEALAEHDERILTSYIEEMGPLSRDRLQQELRSQTQHGLVHPVFFGSARTGAGIDPLMVGIAELLPVTARGDPDAQTSGTVFKIERGVAREKIAYVRLFSGTVRIRDRLVYGKDHEDKVTAIATFDRQPTKTRTSVSAGNIAKIWGLRQRSNRRPDRSVRHRRVRSTVRPTDDGVGRRSP